MKPQRDVEKIAEALASESGKAPPPPNGIRQPGRQGKVSIQSWHDPAVLQQLKVIAAEQGKTQQKLIAEALNKLFLTYGKQTIA